MSQSADGEKQLRHYLLGELAEEEQQRLEQQLLFDDEQVEWLLVTEEELIDSYLAEKLSARERARFETYFLSTPARRQKLLAAKALRRYIATTTSPEPEIRKARQTSWWQQLFAPPVWKLAAAAVLLLGLGVVAWRVFLAPSQVDQGIADLKKAYRQQRPIEARVSGFDHAPWGPTRSGSQTPLDDVLREQAASSLRRAVIEHPDAKSHHALGNHYLLNQEIDKAIDQFELALKADPSNAQIHNDLGAALMELGKLERGKADRGEPGAEGGLKAFGRANEHFEQALQINSQLAEARFNQALCYQRLPLTNQALGAWRKYLELDSSSPWADEANRYIKEIEEQKKKTAWNKDLFWENFLSAYQSGDEERIWETFNLSRERTGNVITERLLDEYLQLSAEGRRDEADQKLTMLARAGELEERMGGDVYTHDLAGFYQSTTPKQRALLTTARERFKEARKQNPYSKEAFDPYHQAREMFARAGNECEARLTDSLIGIIHARRSEHQQGRELAENVAQYAEAHGYYWLQVRSLYLRADLSSGLNEYSKAVDYGKQALALSERLQSPNDVFDLLGQLADTHQFLGDYELSLNWHQRSLALAGRYPIPVRQRWPMYAAVSRTFSDLNLHLTAIAAQKEALHLANDMNSPRHRALSHSFMGEIYGNLNDYGEAIKQMELALEIGRSMSGNPREQNVVAAPALLRLGHIHRKAGNLAPALNYYNQSRQLYEQMNLASPLFNSHRGKLLIYLALRDDSSAQKELAIAQQLFEHDRGKIIEEELRNSFFDAGQDIYDLAIQLYAENRDDEEAFNYSELSRARSLLDLLQPETSHGSERQPGEPRLRSSINTLSLAKIRSDLPSSVQIVQYAVLSEKLYIWVVSKSTFYGVSNAIRLEDLNAKVSDYLKSIRAGEAEAQEAGRLARELYGILIKPIEPFLEAKSDICFVPDEILNYLPFGALIEPASGQYLIEKYVINLSPSSTIFLTCTKAAEIKSQTTLERCLIVGSPLFDRDRFPHLDDLPSTGKEAERVAGYYNQRRLLRAEEARESILWREIQNAEIIHLASHGLINEKLPGYSGIALSKEPSGAESGADGLLEAREVYRLKLPKAKLVVLSACQTWLGRNYRGEGMVGLARAFIAAGVPLVVASLWAVNDATTEKLMDSFHRHRTQNKLPTAKALRQAQLEMLGRRGTRYCQPSAWAAFVTVGGQTDY